MTATTDANGNASFTTTLPTAIVPGQIITATADFNVTSTSNFSNAATVVEVASASFVSTDTTTQGSWRNAYGADGYDIAADTSAANPKLPSYATLSITGGTAYTWVASTTDVRALQNAANTGRIASTWYSATSMSFNLNLTDGQSHEVSLYAVDWDKQGRSEEVQIIDPKTGKVLDTRGNRPLPGRCVPHVEPLGQRRDQGHQLERSQRGRQRPLLRGQARKHPEFQRRVPGA